MEENKQYLGGILAPKPQGYSIKLSHGDYFFEITDLKTEKEFQLWQKAANAYIEGCKNTTEDERIGLCKAIVGDTVKALTF